MKTNSYQNLGVRKEIGHCQGWGGENGLTTTEHKIIFWHDISIVVMITHSMHFPKLMNCILKEMNFILSKSRFNENNFKSMHLVK